MQLKYNISGLDEQIYWYGPFSWAYQRFYIIRLLMASSGEKSREEGSHHGGIHLKCNDAESCTDVILSMSVSASSRTALHQRKSEEDPACNVKIQCAEVEG